MKFTTSIFAIDKRKDNNIVVEWSGQLIEADSWLEAEQYCQNNGLGYLCITGVWVEDISFNRNFDLN